MGQLKLHFLAAWLNVHVHVYWRLSQNALYVDSFQLEFGLLPHRILSLSLFTALAYSVCIVSLSCLSIFNSSFTFQVINSNIANDKWAIYYRGWGNCCLSKEEIKIVHFTFFTLDNVWPEDQVILTMHWLQDGKRALDIYLNLAWHTTFLSLDLQDFA